MRNAFNALLGLSLCVLAVVAHQTPAEAQTAISALVTTTCGTPGIALSAGRQGTLTQNTSGQLCITVGTSGSGLAVFGPTASGSASVNPPVQIGGTVTGAAGANVAGAAVKPASTAAVATDTSLVTQLNPNSPGIITYVDPCQNPGVLKSSVPINITSATTTQLVPISGTTSIYVCHFDMTISEVVTTPNTLQFEYGTSTNCTGTNKLTGLYGGGGVTAGDPIVVNAGFGGTLFTAPSANGLCALTAIGATGSFQGLLTYVQQ